MHEVRSPLSTALLGLQCLQTAVEADEIDHDTLQEMNEDCQFSCEAALQILNDLLLYDKMENKMVSLENGRLLAKDFLLNSIRPFRRQLLMDRKTLAVDMDASLTNVYITVDCQKMDQVIRNFLTNAMKFTRCNKGNIHIRSWFDANKPSSSNGEVPTELSHSNTQYSGQLHFETVDNGVGISQENLLRLFGQYVQIDPSKLQGGKGSGLGLFRKLK